MKKIWMDCDTGTDDAIAMMLAHSLDSLEIVGLSAVCGNTPHENALKNMHRINGLLGTNYPIFPGAEKPLLKQLRLAAKFHGENGLGDVELPLPKNAVFQTKKAWDAIYDCAKELKDDLHLVATGPLTNIATLLSVHPDFCNYVKNIYIMGGSATHGNATPAAEFNIFADPDAAAVVFRSDLHVFMFGLNVTMQAEYRPVDWDELLAFGTPVTKFAHDCVQCSWRNLQKMGLGGVAQHDSCPIMYLAHPEFFEGKEAGVVVETRATITNGKTITDLESDKKFGFKNATVMTHLDREKFIECLKSQLKSI